MCIMDTCIQHCTDPDPDPDFHGNFFHELHRMITLLLIFLTTLDEVYASKLQNSKLLKSGKITEI